MAIGLIPRYRVGSVYELTPEKLRSKGVKLVLADLDNTIARYREPEPSPALFRWKEELNRAGIEVFILSNGRKPNRSRRFAKAFGVDFISHAGKPRRKGFDAALEQTGFAAEETLMIGDVLTEPIALDTVFRRIRYGIETPFRAACPHQEGLE